MNNKIRQVLKNTLSNFPNIINNENKLKAILIDRCPNNILEVNLIINALQLKIPVELTNNNNEALFPILLAKLTKQLEDSFGTTNDKAKWSVITWAVALNLTSETQQEASLSHTQQKSSTPTMSSNHNIIDLGDNIKIKFSNIPSGSFIMGSPLNERGRDANDIEPRPVNISKAFQMSIYPITQEQYEAILGVNDSRKFIGGAYPANYVPWLKAIEFCNLLSQQFSLKPYYTIPYKNNSDDIICDKQSHGFRLPTEAEWEYACRAGSKSSFYWGDKYDRKQMGKYCWYDKNSYDKSRNYLQQHQVGQKLPNDWGLFDMSGLLWEWTSDKTKKKRGYADARIVKGGAYYLPWGKARSSSRMSAYTEIRWDDNKVNGNQMLISVGFRVVRDNV